MSIFYFIRKHLTVNLAAEAIMVAFAGLSLANVEQFFHRIHPHGVASWIGGIALGSILVVMAGLLGRMEVNFRARGYITLMCVTGGLAIISGLIQGAAYDTHMQTLPAYALGLALPLFGELGLALAVGEYIASEKRRRSAMADEGFEARINDAISDALIDIDVSQAKRHIERQAAAIVRHKMDEIVDRRIGKMDAKSGILQESAQKVQESAQSPQRASVTAMNEAKRQKIDDRRSKIRNIIEQFGPISSSDIAERLADDFAISVSPRTATNDCKALAEDGQIVGSSAAWDIDREIDQLPEQPEIHTNGVAHA